LGDTTPSQVYFALEIYQIPNLRVKLKSMSPKIRCTLGLVKNNIYNYNFGSLKYLSKTFVVDDKYDGH